MSGDCLQLACNNLEDRPPEGFQVQVVPGTGGKRLAKRWRLQVSFLLITQWQHMLVTYD